jgi:hypothetical protein
MDLVKFGMDSTDLAKRIKDFGIDFEPTDDYLDALRKVGAQEVVIQALREVKPEPLTREQVGKLVAGGVPSERAVMLVKQYGIDFVTDDEYLQTLRVAGADDALIASLREASEAVAGVLLIKTSPNAEVFLDGQLQGKANDNGSLSLKARCGTYALKVALDGKKDFHSSVSVAFRQTTTIEAMLEDAPRADTGAPGHIPGIWHSETTQHDFRVEVTKDLFRADWVDIPPAAAKQGAYIHTECHRIGSKWVGKSSISLLFAIPGGPTGRNTRLCSLSMRMEVESVSPEKITGHTESLSSFDVNTCHVRNTTWREFTWVPKQ